MVLCVVIAGVSAVLCIVVAGVSVVLCVVVGDEGSVSWRWFFSKSIS